MLFWTQHLHHHHHVAKYEEYHQGSPPNNNVIQHHYATLLTKLNTKVSQKHDFESWSECQNCQLNDWDWRFKCVFVFHSLEVMSPALNLWAAYFMSTQYRKNKNKGGHDEDLLHPRTKSEQKSKIHISDFYIPRYKKMIQDRLQLH